MRPAATVLTNRGWRLAFDEFSGDEALLAARTKPAAARLVCSIEIAYPDAYRRIETDVGRRQCRWDEEL